MPVEKYSASAFAWAADSLDCAAILQVTFVAPAFGAEHGRVMAGEQPRARVRAFGVLSRGPVPCVCWVLLGGQRWRFWCC